MSAPTLFAAPLPTLPNRVSGIVAEERGADGRLRITLQCADCLATETPDIAVLMTYLFHPSTSDGRRRCKACRIAAFPDCPCGRCAVDRTGGYR